MSKPWLVLAAGLFLAASGCINPKDADVDGGVPIRVPLANPLLVDHDHKDPKLHELSTPNMMSLGSLKWDEILFNQYPVQQYGEIDVQGNYAFVAALMAGFAVVDLADAKAPKTLSYTPVTPSYVADIKATKDANLALLGLQGSIFTVARAYNVSVPLPAQIPVPLPPTAVRGILAFDTTNKAMPKPAGYVFVDKGCHMLSLMEQAGGIYVYCAPNDNTVKIFKLVRAGPAVAFEPIATWSPDDLVGQVTYKVSPTASEFTHDMTVQADPITGDPLMLVSFWDRGMWAVDVKDPANPKVLGTWAGQNSVLYSGNLHTTVATKIGDRRVVVTIPEYGKIPAVFVLDATDWSQITLLSEWQAAEDDGYGSDATIFSTHNFQILDEKIYLGMYHGGVWVLDISDPTLPAALGYVLPTGEPTFGFISRLAPDTWDVVVANGYILAVDIPTGLHVYHYMEDPAGDANYDSFA